MAIEVQLPDIGADAAEVTEILVTVGDSVELDAPLLVVGKRPRWKFPHRKPARLQGFKCL